MKNTNRILDDYARDQKKVIFKYKNWLELMEYNNPETIIIHIHNAMQEYAIEAIKADRERVANSATASHKIIKSGDPSSTTGYLKVARVDKDSILNLPIELQ